MARWIGRYADFHCLGCSREWRDVYWAPGDTMAYLADISDKTYVENMTKQQCTCSSPHVTVSYTMPGASQPVHVRSSQRAVVYEHPDGSWQAPGSNDPNDPIATRAAKDGAVRREFHSIRELRSFQRSHSLSSSDDVTASNEVLDFDEPSRRQSDTITRDRHSTREREARLRKAFRMIGGNAGRYDKAVRNRGDGDGGGGGNRR